jgi:hypothetical protein
MNSLTGTLASSIRGTGAAAGICAAEDKGTTGLF